MGGGDLHAGGTLRGELQGMKQSMYMAEAVNPTDSSEKGKPTARWGHKVHGSSERFGDGRAAGEKKEEQ